MPLLGRLLSAGRSGRWAEEESTSDAASSSLSTAGRLSSQLSGGVVGLGRLASRLQSEASLLSPFPRFNLASALESAQESPRRIFTIDEEHGEEHGGLRSHPPGPSQQWHDEEDSDTEVPANDEAVNMARLSAEERHALSKKLQALVVYGEPSAIILMCKWRHVDVNVGDATGLTALHTAAAEGALSTLIMLLSIGADVHVEDAHGAQPVHYAAAAGSMEKLTALTNAGADLDAVTHNGFTALCWAAQGGHLNVVKALVGPMMVVTMEWPDADDSPVPGAVAVGLAMAAGHTQVLRELLKAGCDVAQKAMGFTALHVVVAQELPPKQMEEMIRMLAKEMRMSVRAVHQQTGMTAAHSAAESGCVTALRALRRLGADLAKKDQLGRLPLHVAAGMGHTAAVTELVEVLRVPVQARDSLRHTALHWAAMNGRDTTVEELVRLGAKLHSSSSTGRTALHQAAENGRSTTVTLLRRLGADASILDEFDCTPLQLAVVRGHGDTVRALHAAGDDLLAVNEQGRTLVHYAAEFGHMDVLELLLVHMADPMAADHGGCTPTIAAAANGRADVLRRLVELVRRSDGGGGSVDGGDESKLAHVVKAALAAKAAKAADSTALVASSPTDVKRKRASIIARIASEVTRREWRELATADAQGNTALHWAAAGGHLAAAKVLLHEAHLRLEAVDKDGRSVLMVAVQHRQLAMVTMLVKLGADARTTSGGGVTTIMRAASLPDVAMVELLMQRGAALHATDARGQSALHLAACAEGAEALQMVRHLLRLNMHVDLRDREGVTPLHCACKLSGLPVVELLRENGADLMAVTLDGRTMLHMAACSADTATLTALMRWGVAPAARKQHGQTALHVAAWKGHLQAVEALLAAADQLDCVDDLGRSPLHWAVAHGHLEVARVLIARGFDPKKRDLLGATLLHVATLRGHTELVKELLHLGVEPAQVDRYGSTATELATKPEVNFIFEKHHEKLMREQLEAEMDAVDALLDSGAGLSLNFGLLRQMREMGVEGVKEMGGKILKKLRKKLKKTAVKVSAPLEDLRARMSMKPSKHSLDRSASGVPGETVSSPRITDGGDTRDSDYEMCIVCLARAKSMRVLPCRHTCMCAVCALQLQGGQPCEAERMLEEGVRCPVCRGPVTSIAPVF